MQKRMAAVVTAVLTAAVMAVSLFAADKTPVKVSVGSQQVRPGGDYTVNISLADLSDDGISAMDFAIEYDKSLISVDKVSSLVTSKVGASDEVFDYVKKDGAVNVLWTTKGSTLLKTSGNVFSISGKVHQSAKTGSKAKINIVPISRALYQGSGDNNAKIRISRVSTTGAETYDASVTAGYVTVKASGDVNADGIVDDVDAAIVLKHIMLDKTIESPYDADAADCTEEFGVIDIKDVIWILSNASAGSTTLDLSKAKLPSGADGTLSYSGGVLSAKNVELFGIPLTKTLQNGESVRVYMEVKDKGGDGFRSWLVNDAYGTVSNQPDVFKPAAEGSRLNFELTATDTASALLIKGPVWGTNIGDIEIISVSVDYLSDTAGSNTESTTETTTQAQSSGSGHSHSFGNGMPTSFFSVSGNLSKDYGSVSYNNMTIAQCLKMESATSITFTTGNSGTLRLVFNTNSSGKSITVDGSEKTIPSSGILDVSIGSGSHTVKKKDGQSYLFYMSVS